MPTTINWTSLANGGTYELDLFGPGNNGGDILHFNVPGITPYDIELIGDVDGVTITDLVTFRQVTFLVDGRTVSPQNVTFAGGGVLLVGDGTYDTTNDLLGNELVGTASHDQLVGLNGDDTLRGGDGFDVFTDQFGANSIDGGAGNDFFYVYQDLGSSSTVTGGAGQDFYYLDYESPALLAPPGGPGNDYLVTDFQVGPGGDVIYTSDLVYLAIGYEDEDPFAAGFLRFREEGGILYYEGDRDGAASDVHNWMTLIALQGVTEAEIDFAANLPDLQIGDDGSNTLLGTGRGDLMTALAGNDAVDGLGGKDYLAGGEGNDVLDGGAGVDTMLGGAGDDIYRVDNKDDGVIESSNDPTALLLPGDSDGPALAGVAGITDTVIAAVTFSIATIANVENLTLSGTAARATGNALANLLTGNAGNNTLDGGTGNDTLDGRAGNDRLIGGNGNDTLIWGNGDRLNGGAGTDTLKVKSGDIDLTGQAGDLIASVEAINLTGGGASALTLAGSDLLDLSATDRLTVLGSEGDVVNAVGFRQILDLQGYNRYKSGAAILLVESDVAVIL